MITRNRVIDKYAVHKMLGLVKIKEDILNDNTLFAYKFVRFDPKTMKEKGDAVECVDLGLFSLKDKEYLLRLDAINRRVVARHNKYRY